MLIEEKMCVLMFSTYQCNQIEKFVTNVFQSIIMVIIGNNSPQMEFWLFETQIWYT